MVAIRKKFGLVAIIDALGARNHTIENSISFIKSATKLKKHVKTVYTAAKLVQEKHEKACNLNDINTRFFGDTILFTLETGGNDKITEHMFPMAFLLNTFFKAAIEEGILFRGALSIGDYIETKDIVLGPAVVDAANWYEKIEMVAVMATPQARNYLNSNDTISNGSTGTMMLEYNVPVKDVGIFNTLVFNWPFSTKFSDKHNGKNKITVDEKWFYENFKPFLISPAVNNKYVNTENFFKFSANMFKENLSQYFSKA